MSDINLGYLGGSGGFLALHLLLLSQEYTCYFDRPTAEVIQSQWQVSEPGLWKTFETWPDNIKTADLPAGNRIFFACNPPVPAWEKMSHVKALIYTDLASQMTLCKYKNANMYHASNPAFRRTLDFEFAKLYRNIKQPAWPDCVSLEHAQQLPSDVVSQLLENTAFQKLIKCSDWEEWFFEHYAQPLGNYLVHSECVRLAKHSKHVIRLQDIVNTNGQALLDPFGLTANQSQWNLVNTWRQLHPPKMLEQLGINS